MDLKCSCSAECYGMFNFNLHLLDSDLPLERTRFPGERGTFAHP